jgi:transcriptional regulator of NAD metabolism
MNGEERRNLIIKRLRESKEPISASCLAKDFAVTRQIIVADIALLRAMGYSIVADNKGYVFNTVEENSVKRIAVKHDKSQVLPELYAIVDHGGKILDVIVEHSIYGRIAVELNISSRYDVDEFVKKINATKANPLSLLTEGVHIHTIVVEDEKAFVRIKERLTELGILIEST